MKNLLKALLLTLVLLGLILYIFYIDSTNAALTRLRVEKHDIVHEQIPASFNNVKILYFSDLHAYSLGAEYQTKIFEKIQSMDFDLVLFGGDLIESSINMNDEEVLSLIEQLNAIEAPLGKFAVLGNEDRDRLELVQTIYAQSGFEILGTQSIPLHNLSNEYIVLNTVDLFDSSIGQKLDGFSITLSYNPLGLEGRNDPLMLSAMTHKGQVRFPVLGSRYHKEAMEYAPPVDGVWIASNGLGVDDYKARFLTDPSLYLITLIRK